MATIRQIAKLAGVSIGTVSRALRDDPRFSAETRRRIQAIARELNFHPNRLTQGLLTGRSGVIGCLVPRVESGYYSRVLKGILQAAHEHSYHIMPFETRWKLENTIISLHQLVEQRVDGVLIACAHENPLPLELLLDLWSHDIRTVAVQNTLTPIPIDYVGSDEETRGQLAVDYLVGLGHRSIAFIGFISNDLGSERSTAVFQALRRHGLSTTLHWDTFLDPSIERALTYVLSQPERPTAIIAMSDVEAGKIIQLADAFQLKIPAQLSVLGSGNHDEWLELFKPPLTSIEEHPELIGRTAFEIVLQRIPQPIEAMREHPITRLITPEIVVRESCAAPAA